MAEGRTVKVERSRARGHVASNTLTVRPGAIQSRPRFCLGSRVDAHPNRSVLVNEKTRLLSVRFFEASAPPQTASLASRGRIRHCWDRDGRTSGLRLRRSAPFASLRFIGRAKFVCGSAAFFRRCPLLNIQPYIAYAQSPSTRRTLNSQLSISNRAPAFLPAEGQDSLDGQN